MEKKTTLLHRPALRQTKKKIKAAGVLCYSKDAHGNTWFLLGRERPNPKWGKDSNSWSEFGGSLNRDETPEEGAAREFFEESMGVIYGHPQWMERELREDRYLLTLDSSTPSGKGYRSFIKYIPFADYPSKFARYRTLAKKQPHMLAKLIPECFDDASSSNCRVSPVCMEKTSISWFSAQQLCNTINHYQDPRDPPNPKIRRGFALDFTYLMHTPWGQSGFKDESTLNDNTLVWQRPNLPPLVPEIPRRENMNRQTKARHASPWSDESIKLYNNHTASNWNHHHHHHYGGGGVKRKKRRKHPQYHLQATHNDEWTMTVERKTPSPLPTVTAF